MFTTLRLATAAAALALLAAPVAQAAAPKHVEYWADAQTASRAGDRHDGDTARYASRAGDRYDGAAAQEG